MLKCTYMHRHVYLWIYKNTYFLSKVKVCVKTFRILKKVGPLILPLEKSNKFPKYPQKNPLSSRLQFLLNSHLFNCRLIGS